MDKSDNFDPAPRSWSTIQERNRSHLQNWCNLAGGLQLVSGQWKASILIDLSESDRTLPEIQRRLELASRRVLVRALRELEGDGLVSRSPLTVPVYSLTQHAVRLVPILMDLSAWNESRKTLPV